MKQFMKSRQTCEKTTSVLNDFLLIMSEENYRQRLVIIGSL